MKRILFILLTVLSITAAVFAFMYLSGARAELILFVLGGFCGIFLMNLIVMSKNNKINSYARELEKESIISNESSSKVKVLESKIEVLEKALENALKNK